MNQCIIVTTGSPTDIVRERSRTCKLLILFPKWQPAPVTETNIQSHKDCNRAKLTNKTRTKALTINPGVRTGGGSGWVTKQKPKRIAKMKGVRLVTLKSSGLQRCEINGDRVRLTYDRPGIVYTRGVARGKWAKELLLSPTTLLQPISEARVIYVRATISSSSVLWVCVFLFVFWQIQQQRCYIQHLTAIKMNI